MPIQIQCIRKTNRFNPWERITHAGGVNANGTRLLLTQQEAIDGIEFGKWSFIVRPSGREVHVIIKISRFWYKYLTMEADDEQPDNLLSLPECP